VRKWWGFLDRGFNRRDYAAAARLVHNSNPYWAWHDFPNERSPSWTCASFEEQCAISSKTSRVLWNFATIIMSLMANSFDGRPTLCVELERPLPLEVGVELRWVVPCILGNLRCSSLTKLPELLEEDPDSDPDGRALKAEPDDNGLEVEELRWLLAAAVWVEFTSWEIRLISVIALLAISRICRWTDLSISKYFQYN
jgi:hypothetical protein